MPRDQRRPIPLLRSDNAYSKRCLHQERMFGISRRQTVSSIIRNCVELIQLVLTQSFAGQSGNPECCSRNYKYTQGDDQSLATERTMTDLGKQIGPKTGSDYRSNNRRQVKRSLRTMRIKSRVLCVTDRACPLRASGYKTAKIS